MLCLNLRSEIKNRIFEKLENYWDTTEDKIDRVINLERQWDYKTAVKEFYVFADKKTVSIMNRKGKEDGLIGKVRTVWKIGKNIERERFQEESIKQKLYVVIHIY